MKDDNGDDDDDGGNDDDDHGNDDDGKNDDDKTSLGSTGSSGKSQGVAEAMVQRVRIKNMQALVIVLLLSGICKRGQISFKGQISYRIQILYVLL